MILAVLQARMSSSRLPGKVMKPILGKPMLFRQVERLLRAKKIDSLMIATSNQASDDPISTLCVENDLACYRGSLNDVLDRYYRACQSLQPQYVVRVTGDCPLCDPEVIDQVIEFGVSGGFDYATNAFKRTFPHGLDVEIMRFGCLETAWREATHSPEREHVTPFIYQHPEKFRIGYYTSDNNRSHLRWTVDEPLDFELVSRIYEALYPENPEFRTDDILQLLQDKPELETLNAVHKQFPDHGHSQLGR